MITHSVKNPLSVKTAAAMTLFGLMSLGSFIRQWNTERSIPLLCFFGVMFLLCMLVLGWMLYRSLQKPAALRLDGQTLHIRGQHIRADEIQAILSEGYFRPVIGIKPNGKAIVPVRLCFRFAKDEEKAIGDLAAWADQNRVTMIDKASFLKWI